MILIFFINYLNNLTFATPQNISLTREFLRREKSLNSHKFKWANGSDIVWTPEIHRINKESGNPVDCFGVGRIASSLEWLLAKNNSNDGEVKFFMSSNKQTRRVRVNIGSQFGLEWTDFVINRRTVIIVHGFLANGEENWIRRMEEAFHVWVRNQFKDLLINY